MIATIETTQIDPFKVEGVKAACHCKDLLEAVIKIEQVKNLAFLLTDSSNGKFLEFSVGHKAAVTMIHLIADLACDVEKELLEHEGLPT